MKSFAPVILVFILSRIAVNFTRRFAYPFIPAIADQLGTSVSSVQTALALGWGVGIASPLFGSLSERYGRKSVMLATLMAMAAISLLGAVWTEFWMFGAVIVGYGVGKVIFDPAMQAYIGERIPFHRRAMAWGAIELSWAGALFVAAPLTGFLLTRNGLNLVFVTLFLMMGASGLLMWRMIPSTTPTLRHPAFSNPLNLLRQARQQPQVLVALGYTIGLITGQEIFFINYGLWMELSFDLLLTALGVVTLVIGVAEMVGELIVSLAGDRLGKRNLALVGSLLAGIGFAIMPHLSHSLPLAMTGMFLLFVLTEVAIVASITLFTEILPEARAVMMSANISAASLGRLIGALLGGSLLALTNNFALVGVVAMTIVLLGGGLMWFIRGIE